MPGQERDPRGRGRPRVDQVPAAGVLEGIERAALRAGELCSQMLAYSSKGTSEPEAFDLNQMIREMRSLLDLQKVPLRCNLDDSVPTIEGNVSQIRQVVMNLILNATDAVDREDGIVEITDIPWALVEGRVERTR